MAQTEFQALISIGINASSPAVANHVDNALRCTAQGAEIVQVFAQYNEGMVTFAELLNIMQMYLTPPRT